MPNKRPTPRERVQDAHARESGRNLAEFRDGDSARLLAEAKRRTGSATYTGNGLTDSWDSPSVSTTGEETARYRATMEKAYDAQKNQQRRAAGLPTGYDAAMRGVVKPTSPLLDMIRRAKYDKAK